MTQDLPTRYDPKLTEDKWYKYWEEKKLFIGKITQQQKPFVIVIPPPNITGILHMGHALNNTIQDILIRWMRMKGVSTLWIPGTDHAGIATQNVVERKLAKENKDRRQLGREKFLEYVWRWRQEYGSTIINQLKKLGCSCDWSRTRFTMDEGLSNAVVEVFVRLYEKGLIYRGKYIINWCPRCQTALSDEESHHKDLNGNLYHIKYPVKDSKDFVVVATTRPETMLGDTAVAINPNDSRYQHLKGKCVILPVIGREIPVIFDEMVDMEFGTGVVKVTPSHDPNDFSLGQKHHLEFINILNPDATMNKNAADYAGMDRFEAREALVEYLKEKKLLLKVEPHNHAVGHCYRCNTIIEPYISWQWFVKMQPLAEPAIKAVVEKNIKFYPERWTGVYLDWMQNIRDWCISRQIWWGHRLPVYYCKSCVKNLNDLDDNTLWTFGKKGVIVSRVKPQACPDCGGTDIIQDEDVLDTWFSSWLWPFSTLGWPVHTKDLDYFYPTSVLVTAQEIIFFWVARMIMAGLEFIGEIPFSSVYIHGTVRDDTGAKMSKSLGNIIDPLEIIDEFGTDALRFSIISITAAGQDVFLSKNKFEIGRNFANKIWNASRFIMMNADLKFAGDLSKNTNDLRLSDKWILHLANQTIEKVDIALKNYRFNEAANCLYEFFWHYFCDWYIELVKPDLLKKEPKRYAAVSSILVYVLLRFLKMLHPFMPYITEEVYQRLKDMGLKTPDESIMVSSWPEIESHMLDTELEKAMQEIINIITGIRNIRSEFNIEPKKQLKVYTKDALPKNLIDNNDYIQLLAKVNGNINVLAPAEFLAIKGATILTDNLEFKADLHDAIDFDAEQKRIEQLIHKHEKLLNAVDNRLHDNNFVTKAPKDVLEKEKEKQINLSNFILKCRQNLKDLS